MQKKLSAMLATAALLGATVTACTGNGAGPNSSSVKQSAAHLAPRVEAALADRQFSRALEAAEALVAVAPQDAGHRAMLGRAYLANGRYLSARAAFADAMTLGNRDARTIISLALCEIALGDSESAHALLAAHSDHLPVGDYGLAMAMAGDTSEGVRALVEAARQPDATAQTRQNLAYALSLAGAWGQARLIAGQDLTAKEAERRVGQWSQPALRDDSRQRVAALTGVAPRGDDAGMPVHLALEAGGAIEMAAATPDLAGQAVASVQTADPVPEPTPAAATVELADVTPAHAPLARAPDETLREAMHASFQRPSSIEIAARPAPARAQPRTMPVTGAQASDWVVQLGAFDSEAVAQEKWRAIRRSQSALAGFQDVHSQLTHNGRVFHRVAVRGFADRKKANALCKTLTARGQSCFVRLDDSGATQMARAGGKPKGAR